MLTFLNIFGGVALILFGVRFLRRGLDRLFGMSLGTTMQSLAGSRLRAFCTGLGVSVIAPSSTTISMLAVQTVQAGRLSSRQVLAIMFGADIRLTVTVQLLALRVEQFAPILILFGVALFQFTRSSRWRAVGHVVLSLGFIFLGIMIIREGSAGFKPGGEMVTLLRLAGDHPLIIAVLAAILAMLLQSSTATIALVMGLAGGANGGSGQPLDLSLAIAIPWVVGANLGIVLTTLLIGWKEIDSRRLATGNLLAKLTMGAAVLLTLEWVARGAALLPGSFANQVAHVHTGFNAVLALLGLPLVEWISRLVEYLVPIPIGAQRPTFGPRYIRVDGPIDSVALALGQSSQEILHMSEIVRGMFEDLWQGLRAMDEQKIRMVRERDDQVDLLDEHLKRFLIRVASRISNTDEAAEQMRQLRFVAELETIGDIIDKNLAEVMLKKLQHNMRFSDRGWEELCDFYKKVLENMTIAETAFTTRNRELARQLLRHKERLDNYNRELHDRHFARLNAGLSESRETSAVHLDLLTHLHRVNSSVSHVAFAVLQESETGPPTPEG